MYELRPYQLDCIERARIALQDPDRPCRRLILESPTGSGKTVIASHLIHRAVNLDKRVLFLAHSRELVYQCAEKLQAMGVYHGIIMRGMPYNPNAPVQVASKDTLYVRGLRQVGARALDSLPAADLIVLDECFPPGTLVDGRPIEEIRPGDMVTSHLGPRRVLRAFCNRLRGPLVTIHFRSGQYLTCTANHKVMLASGELVPACQLIPHTAVRTIAHEEQPGLRSMRVGLSRSSQSQGDMLQDVRGAQEVCCSAWPHAGAIMHPVRTRVHTPTQTPTQDMLSEMCRSQEAADIGAKPSRIQSGRGASSQSGREQSHEEIGGASEGLDQAQGHGLEAACSRRERLWAHGSPTPVGIHAGMADGSHYPNTPQASVPQVLQGGHRKHGPQGRHRSGWPKPRRAREPGSGPPSGCSAGIDWVDRVEVQEQGGPCGSGRLCPGGVVFNLEVEEAHTYNANGIIVSNCHRSVAPTWKRLVEAYPDAVCIGLTATPARADGKGLGDLWDRIIKVDTYKNLIDAGFLVPTRVFAPWSPDLKGVRSNSKGDYRESDLEERVAKREIVGRVVDHLQEHATDLSTIVFCVTINHSLMVLDELRDRGVVCEHVDGEMNSGERDHILHRFKQRGIQVVTNCMVLRRQMAGRIQRPSPGKDYAMIIDMAGAVYQHGFPDDDMAWILTETQKATKLKDNHPSDEPGQVRVCKSCGFVMRERVRFCPECGGLVRADKRAVKEKPGKVKELQRRRVAPASKKAMQDYWYKCIGIAIGKNAKIGMAAHLYRARFNVWPSQLKHVPQGKEQWNMKARDYYATAFGVH
jgi:DNA repair protein RadD